MLFYYSSTTACFPLKILTDRSTSPMGHACWAFLPKSRTPTIIINAAPHLRSPNPGFNPGFTPHLLYKRGGGKPGVWRPEIWAEEGLSYDEEVREYTNRWHPYMCPPHVFVCVGWGGGHDVLTLCLSSMVRRWGIATV
jgi:hypothetical protein